MSGFALRYPFFIIMMCLVIAVVGVVTVARMPVDLFPNINIPVVVVATFYNGMPPEQIETDITGRFERFFTLGSGIDHIESRSLPASASSRSTSNPEWIPTPPLARSQIWPWPTFANSPRVRCHPWCSSSTHPVFLCA